MNKWTLLSAAVLVSMSGCATMQVQKDKVGATKTLAIIGYSGHLNLDDGSKKGGIAGAIGAAKGMADLTSGKLDARRVEQAELGYAELSKRLTTTFGVNVADRSTLARSQTFQGLLGKSPNSGMLVVGSQRLPDVLRAEVASSAKPEVRKAVASELGVDALATLNVRYEIGSKSGFTVGGMGKMTVFPRAVVDFTVYDANGNAIWHDGFARGQPTTEGLATTMGADIVANETEVLNASLQSGIDALIARYQEAK